MKLAFFATPLLALVLVIPSPLLAKFPSLHQSRSAAHQKPKTNGYPVSNVKTKGSHHALAHPARANSSQSGKLHYSRSSHHPHSTVRHTTAHH